jgi:hypothetical protein
MQSATGARTLCPGTVPSVIGIWWAFFWFAIGALCVVGVVFTRWHIRVFEGWKYTDPKDGPSDDLVIMRRMQFMLGAVVGVAMGIFALVSP